MSPRRNRPHKADKPQQRPVGDRHGLERTESWQGQEWVMRPVAGNTGKTYRCPGCDQAIPPGVGHVVAWPTPEDSWTGGVDDRRHWHRPCWDARDRRSAKFPRSRNPLR